MENVVQGPRVLEPEYRLDLIQAIGAIADYPFNHATTSLLCRLFTNNTVLTEDNITGGVWDEPTYGGYVAQQLGVGTTRYIRDPATNEFHISGTAGLRWQGDFSAWAPQSVYGYILFNDDGAAAFGANFLVPFLFADGWSVLEFDPTLNFPDGGIR